MNSRDLPRFVLSAAILALFAYAFVSNPSEQLLIGALIAMGGTAVNYWLGSSKGSADKSEELSRQTREPQTVTIDQPPDAPVPTTDVDSDG